MLKSEKSSNEEILETKASLDKKMQETKVISSELYREVISDDKTDENVQKYENNPEKVCVDLCGNVKYENILNENREKLEISSNNKSMEIPVDQNNSGKLSEGINTTIKQSKNISLKDFDENTSSVKHSEGGDLSDDIIPYSKAQTVIPPQTKENIGTTNGKSSQTKSSRICKLRVKEKAIGIFTVIFVLVFLVGSTVWIVGNSQQQVEDIEVTLSAEYYGTVRLALHGLERSLCMEGWNDKSCRAVCREIDYSYGVAAFGLNDTFLEEETLFFSGNFSCTGNESLLEQCLPEGHIFETISNCTKDKYASCICSFEQIRAKAELSDGYQGRVQISLAGFFGTVCQNGWKDTDCRVVCRQLGRSDGVAVHRAHFGEGNGRIWAESFRCSGSEESLDQCLHSPWGIHTCDHSEDASCVCSKNNTAYNTYEVNLTHGTSGYAQISINGYIGRFCYTGTDGVCSLVCKGKNMGFFMDYAMPASKTKMLARVQCAGQEKNIIDCPRHTWGHGSCPSASNGDIYCICSKTPITPEVKLTHASYGIVHLQLDTTWGTVGSIGWDDNDCRVVCRQLQFRIGQQISNAIVAKSHEIIWSQQFSCNGTEKHIGQCFDSGGGVCSNCEHAQDASCACTNYTSFRPSVLSLSGNKMGRVKVKVAGMVGGLCSNDISQTENCEVICRELKLEYVGATTHLRKSGNSVLSLQCKGRERSILQCQHELLRSQNDCRYGASCDCNMELHKEQLKELNHHMHHHHRG